MGPHAASVPVRTVSKPVCPSLPSSTRPLPSSNPRLCPLHPNQHERPPRKDRNEMVVPAPGGSGVWREREREATRACSAAGLSSDQKSRGSGFSGLRG